MNSIIKKLSWAEQAFNEMDEQDFDFAIEQAKTEGIVADIDGELTDEFKLWYYKQVKG